MKQEITLEQYLRLGGKLEKVNWSDAYCDYGDHNRGAKVISYEDKGEKNGHDTPYCACLGVDNINLNNNTIEESTLQAKQVYRAVPDVRQQPRIYNTQ